MSETGKAHASAARRASRQHGAITHVQALDSGLTRGQVTRLLRTGQWRRAAPGVYVVAGAPATWKQILTVACLAGPPGTVASYRSAAALFGFCPPPPRPEVTVTVNASVRRHLAVAHRSALAQADVCIVDGIPATIPARTLVDCAGVLGFDDLCDLVDTACYRHPRLARRVGQAVGRAGSQGRRGVAALRAAMRPWTSGVRPGSPAEARCLRAFERWGLPAPERQYPVLDAAGREVGRTDFAWPDYRVLFAYDGEEFHGPRAWLDDARREGEIDKLGWTVERGDKDDFRPSATRLRDRLRHLLGCDEPERGAQSERAPAAQKERTPAPWEARAPAPPDPPAKGGEAAA